MPQASRYILLGVLNIFITQIPALPARNQFDDSELQFFQRIQGLNLPWEEIMGSYKNVSAEMETAMCKSKCKTAAALWVLQDLRPCEKIEKVDCPKGLVCCTSGSGGKASSLWEREEIKIRSTERPKIPLFEQAIMQDGIPDGTNDSAEHAAEGAESEDEVVTTVPLMAKVDDAEDFFYPELILDPIPNDEFP